MSKDLSWDPRLRVGDRHAHGPGGFAAKEWWLIFFRWVGTTNWLYDLKLLLGVIKRPYWENQTIEMYGNFE